MGIAPKFKKLEARHQAFIDHYCVHFNARQAAIHAGFSVRSANVQGCALLQNAAIKSAIEKRTAKRFTQANVTADMIFAEACKIAFVEPSKFLKITPGGKPRLDMSGCTPDDLKAVEGITETSFQGETKVGVKLASKLAALTFLAKMQKLLTDRVEVEGLDQLAKELAAARKRGA